MSVKILLKIITRYKDISLKRMTELLDFKNSKELEKWLIDLPEEIAFCKRR